MQPAGFAVALVMVAALGCGGPAVSVPPLAAPPSAPASSASSAPPAPPPVDCAATLVTRRVVDRMGRRPGDWTRVGTVVVTMKEKKPTSFALKDREGGRVSERDAPDRPDAFRDAVRLEVCKVGGVSVVAEADPPANGAYALSVWRPVAPDETSDLAYVCKGPPGPVSEGLDPAQLRVVAVEAYEVMLTSPKWRTFFRTLREDLRKDEAKDDVRRERAAALRSAVHDCWFSRILSP